MLKSRHAVLGLALLLALLGDSWGQSQAEPPGQNPDNAQQRTNTEQRDTEHAPVIIKISPSEQTQPKPNTDKEKGPENRSDAWTLSDKIAVIASIVALLQFFALVGTVFVLVHTARRQLRAYVFPENVSIVDIISSPKTTIIFKNCGQTPAYNQILWHVLAVAVYPLTIEPTAPIGIPTTSTGHLGPGMKNHSSAAPDIAITADEIEAIKAGKAALYFAGGVTYTDAFGKDRTTKFCYYRGGSGDTYANGPMTVYQKWNEAD